MDDEKAERLIENVGRLATANEELIRLATEERDSGESILAPALCPHCGRLNPQIIVLNGNSAGAMGNYVLHAQCQNCQEQFYAAAQGFLAFRTQAEYEGYLEGRNDDKQHS